MPKADIEIVPDGLADLIQLHVQVGANDVQLVFDIGAQEHTPGGLRIDASHHRAKVSASIQAGLRRVSTRVRVTTAARFASKASSDISTVCLR